MYTEPTRPVISSSSPGFWEIGRHRKEQSISYISRRKKKRHKKQNVTVLHWSVVDRLIGGGRRSLRSLHVVCWPSTSSIHSAHCALRSESTICHIRSFQPFLDDLFLEGGDLHICYALEGHRQSIVHAAMLPVYRRVSHGLGWPANAMFFYNRIRENNFFTLPVVDDNEIVRGTSDGIEGKQV